MGESGMFDVYITISYAQLLGAIDFEFMAALRHSNTCAHRQFTARRCPTHHTAYERRAHTTCGELTSYSKDKQNPLNRLYVDMPSSHLHFYAFQPPVLCRQAIATHRTHNRQPPPCRDCAHAHRRNWTLCSSASPVVCMDRIVSARLLSL